MLTILSMLFGGVFKLIPGLTGQVLDHIEKKANTETERARIQAVRDQHMASVQANVIQSGMQFKAFWVPWLIATVPLAVWFGWGMLDTTLNGALPDTAEIPDGLLPWAREAWSNLFYAGGGVAGASIIARSIQSRK